MNDKLCLDSSNFFKDQASYFFKGVINPYAIEGIQFD